MDGRTKKTKRKHEELKKDPIYYSAIHDFFEKSNFEASRRFTVKEGYSIQPLKNLVEKSDLFNNNSVQWIHIAGSIGKGSISTYLARMFQLSDLKVGLYTSPHFLQPYERIQIDGKPIDDRELFSHFKYYIDHFSDFPISYFDFFTFAALRYFIQSKVKWGIMEAGLGGRLDSTNIIFPKVVILTTISLDHTEILGDSLEKIAKEKAGIIKEKVIVFSTPQKAEVREILIKTSKEKNSTISFFPDEEWNKWNHDFAKQNKEFAEWIYKTIFKKTPPQIDSQIIGRFEIRNRNPFIIFDAAHNLAALFSLSERLKKLLNQKKITSCHIAMNTMQERNLKEFVEPFLSWNNFMNVSFHLFPMDDKRFYSKEILDAKTQKLFKDVLNASLTNKILNNPKDCLVITGSIYLYAKLKDYGL